MVDGNYLYVIGGCSVGFEYLDIVERFDFSKNMWVMFFLFYVKRLFVSGIVVKYKVFVFGGFRNLLRVEDFCEMYDFNINIWSIILSEVVLKYFVIVSVISFKGNIYVFGVFKIE